MSLFKAIAPIGAVVILGLVFTLGIHQYSKTKTWINLRQIAEQRAAEADSIRTEALKIRIAEARARYAEVAAAQKKTAKVAAIAALPGDPAKGKNTYMTCMVCHGMKGEGKRAFHAPRLAGQEPWYIKKQLLKFKESIRGTHPQDLYGMQMAPMAKLMTSNETIDNVVKFIALLEPGSVADKGNGDATAGKQHYAVCALCHGPKAQGSPGRAAPKLSNQHAWYLERQLKNFKNSIRGAHEEDLEGKIMIPMGQMLSDDKVIADLIVYIQSLNE